MFSFLRSRREKSNPKHARHEARRRMAFESLEQRQMLSVAPSGPAPGSIPEVWWTSNYANVEIRGTVASDTIELSQVRAADGQWFLHIDGTNLSKAPWYGKIPLSAISTLSIYGYGGHDTITNSANLSIRMQGGAGDDVIRSTSPAPASIHGEAGNDSLFGGSDLDTIHGGEDNDLIEGSNSIDAIYVQNNVLYVYGTPGNDTFEFCRNNSRVYIRGNLPALGINSTLNRTWAMPSRVVADGGLGDDTISNTSLLVPVSIYGGLGNDTLSGGSGLGCKLYGGSGNDTLYGSDHADVLFGNDGNNIIYGKDGHDTIYGGDGNDTIYGGDGNDKLWGGDHDDQIFGGSGDDYLNGDWGNDTLLGDAGRDTLIGGPNPDPSTRYIVQPNFPSDSDTIHALRAEYDQVIAGREDRVVWLNPVNPIPVPAPAPRDYVTLSSPERVVSTSTFNYCVTNTSDRTIEVTIVATNRDRSIPPKTFKVTVPPTPRGQQHGTPVSTNPAFPYAWDVAWTLSIDSDSARFV